MSRNESGFGTKPGNHNRAAKIITDDADWADNADSFWQLIFWWPNLPHYAHYASNAFAKHQCNQNESAIRRSSAESAASSATSVIYLRRARAMTSF